MLILGRLFRAASPSSRLLLPTVPVQLAQMHTSLAPESRGPDTKEKVLEYASKKQTGVSLKYMLDFGQNPIDRQLLLSAQFLHRELPVRLAHRVKELEKLPYGLSSNKHILTVQTWYEESLTDLLRLPRPKTFEDDLEFTTILRHIYDRHLHVVPLGRCSCH